MAKACSPPACKICGTAHWSQQPHDRAGLKAVTKPQKAAAIPQKAQRLPGRGAR